MASVRTWLADAADHADPRLGERALSRFLTTNSAEPRRSAGTTRTPVERALAQARLAGRDVRNGLDVDLRAGPARRSPSGPLEARPAASRRSPSLWAWSSPPRSFGRKIPATRKTTVRTERQRNARLRPRSRISRRATSQMARRAAHDWTDLHEELRQGRRLEGEAPDRPGRPRPPPAAPRRSTSAGTSSRTKSPFRSTTVSPAAAVEPGAPEPSTSTSRWRRPDAARSSSIAPVGGDPAAGDDHDVLADVLDEVELVAGEDDPDAGRRPLAEDLRHRRDAERVEAAERLVEDEQLRVVDERRARAGRAAGCRATAPRASPRPVGQPQAVEPARRRRVRRLRRHPVLLGEVAELLADPHPRVEAALLGHVAEAEPRRPVDRLAAPSDRAAVRAGEAEDAAHRRRLAGAVRPEEADEPAGPDGERRAVEGDDAPVALREVLDLKHRGGQSSAGSIRLYRRSGAGAGRAVRASTPSGPNGSSEKTASIGRSKNAAIRRARWRLGEYSPRSM